MFDSPKYTPPTKVSLPREEFPSYIREGFSRLEDNLLKAENIKNSIMGNSPIIENTLNSLKYSPNGNGVDIYYLKSGGIEIQGINNNDGNFKSLILKIGDTIKGIKEESGKVTFTIENENLDTGKITKSEHIFQIILSPKK